MYSPGTCSVESPGGALASLSLCISSFPFLSYLSPPLLGSPAGLQTVVWGPALEGPAYEGSSSLGGQEETAPAQLLKETSFRDFFPKDDVSLRGSIKYLQYSLQGVHHCNNFIGSPMHVFGGAAVKGRSEWEPCQVRLPGHTSPGRSCHTPGSHQRRILLLFGSKPI